MNIRQAIAGRLVHCAPKAAWLAVLAAAGLTACATGTTNGSGDCTAATCRAAIDCGTISNGCGGALDCGSTCTGTETCGGGGTPNVCGSGGASGLFLGGFFPIAAYGTPPGDFAAWKAIGINAVQGVPSMDVAGWASEARALGLKQIRQPIGSTGATPPTAGNYGSMNTDPDKGSGRIIAWEGVMPDSSGWDEIEFSMGPPSLSTQNYAVNTGNALHALDASTPTFLNSGINGLQDTASGWPYPAAGNPHSYAGLFQSIDFICNDIYPYGGCSYNDEELRCPRGGAHDVSASDTAGWPVLAPIQGFGSIASIGAILDKLHATPGLESKHLSAFVEAACVTSASEAQLGGVVTPGGIRAEMWNAIIHRARGIMIFVYAGQLNHSTSDGGGCGSVSAANQAEIHKSANLITSLGSVLQDDIDPVTLGATITVDSCTGGTCNAAGDAPGAPLQVAWRDTLSGKYFFVLNTSANKTVSARIALSGAGGGSLTVRSTENDYLPSACASGCSYASSTITDTFAPYAVHVYSLP